MIDGHKLILHLNDWWYSSFGYEETEESKAIKKVIDEVERYVEQDRKTEPMKSTDYCKICNHKGCETCAADGSNPYCVPSRYEPKKKSCADCEYHDWEVDEHIGFRDICNGIGKCPNKTEPQKEVTACPIIDDDAWIYEEYRKGVDYAWSIAQKVFDSTVTFYEAEDVAKQIDKDINVRSKTEPQTYKINPKEPTNMPKCFDCEDFFTCGGHDGQCEIECEKCKHFREEADTYTKQCEFYFMECRYEPTDEPPTDISTGCSKCESRYWCDDRDKPNAVHCNNYGKTEPHIVGKHADVIIIDEPQTCNDCDQQRCETCVTEVGRNKE